ncbi:regulatory protein RecX [Hahella sp. SMD15-11]|uniref:Regulatory protein RecX n=1 Tax=Thermohahella caldifontis TaxID=3142973 RepID=A0AB39UY46_9GAMM
MNEDQHTTELLKRALGLLARREHCRSELARKLARHATNPRDLDKVLDHCVAENWLNEVRYAAMLARNRASAGWGPRRVEHELKCAGLSETDIRAGLKDADVDWYATAADWLVRRKPDLSTEEARWKARGRLLQRGFTQDQADHALDVAEALEKGDVPSHGRG